MDHQRKNMLLFSKKSSALSLYAFELHLVKNSTVLWWYIALVSFCTGPNSANWQQTGVLPATEYLYDIMISGVENAITM